MLLDSFASSVALTDFLACVRCILQFGIAGIQSVIVAAVYLGSRVVRMKKKMYALAAERHFRWINVNIGFSTFSSSSMSKNCAHIGFCCAHSL